MAKLKNLSLNDSSFLRFVSNNQGVVQQEGIFAQITSFAGQGGDTTLPFITAYKIISRIPLQVGETSIKSITVDDVSIDLSSSSVEVMNFDDNAYGNYVKISTDTYPLADIAIPRRYTLCRSKQLSKYDSWGLLTVYEEVNHREPGDSLFAQSLPKGVYLVYIDSTGKVALNPSPVQSWEVAFANPFILLREEQHDVNGYKVVRTPIYSGSNNKIDTNTQEFYITHNSGFKELYMVVDFLCSSLNWNILESPIRYAEVGSYALSDVNFFSEPSKMKRHAWLLDGSYRIWASGMMSAAWGGAPVWKKNDDGATINSTGFVTLISPQDMSLGEGQDQKISLVIHMFQEV